MWKSFLVLVFTCVKLLPLMQMHIWADSSPAALSYAYVCVCASACLCVCWQYSRTLMGGTQVNEWIRTAGRQTVPPAKCAHTHTCVHTKTPTWAEIWFCLLQYTLSCGTIDKEPLSFAEEGDELLRDTNITSHHNTGLQNAGKLHYSTHINGMHT